MNDSLGIETVPIVGSICPFITTAQERVRLFKAHLRIIRDWSMVFDNEMNFSILPVASLCSLPFANRGAEVLKVRCKGACLKKPKRPSPKASYRGYRDLKSPTKRSVRHLRLSRFVQPLLGNASGFIGFFFTRRFPRTTAVCLRFSRSWIGPGYPYAKP